MQFSIVIPAYNEERLLAGSLATIRAAFAPYAEAGVAIELVVVDNASTDATAAVAAEAGARVVSEPVRQIGRARNTGAAVASGEWLVFIDADSWPSRELVADMLECIRSGRVVGGGSTVDVHDIPFLLWLIAWSWNGLARLFGWAAGSFLFCRADAFAELGGFDLELYVAEEIEFSRRLRGWGRPRGLGFVVLHRHPLRTSERKAWLYSGWELFRGFWGMVRHPRRFFRDPSLCYHWYDGRR